MAFSIASAKFSFHRFEPVDYILPAYRAFDAAFQFLVNGYLPIVSGLKLRVCDSAGIVYNPFSVETSARIIGYKFRIPNAIFNQDPMFLNSIAVNDVERNYNGIYSYEHFKRVMYEDFGYTIGLDNTFITNGLDDIVISWGPNTSLVQENTLQAFWGRGYVAATGDYISPWFKPRECFSYCLVDLDDNILGKTNKLQVATKEKFTSLLTYQNNEEAFDFIYEGSPNIVRLPFYLSRPQWPEKKTLYVKSNGMHKLLSSFIEEQYELRTEYMPVKMHRFMKIAFAHDQVIIDCSTLDESPVEVVNSDSYNPEWDSDIEMKTAQGKSIITVAAFGYSNDNYEKDEQECSPPLMSIGLITENGVRLLFQLPEGVKSILVNYRRVGVTEWQGVVFDATTEYLLSPLYEGSDYEVRSASNCGTGYAGFGRIKTFKTLGAVGCTSPHDLDLASLGNDQVFQFQVVLPLPEPATLDLLHMRPDGSVVQIPISTTGFTDNPFVFDYSDSKPLQLGQNKFKVRSVCGPDEKSAWTNEIIKNFQVATIETNVQTEFKIFAGQSGSLVVKRNGGSVVNTSSAVTTTFNAIQSDQIDVNVSSSNGAPVKLKVYYQDLADNSISLLFDSGSLTAPTQSYSFSINTNYIYFITASI